MRPVLSADLICAGRAVLTVRPEDQSAVADTLIFNAKVADRHRLRFGQIHPEFGSGTLADAARLFGMAPEPTICRGEFARALVYVLEAVIRAAPSRHHVLS